jgi:Putative Actinobacterial Holin-X, holin superfamily III
MFLSIRRAKILLPFLNQRLGDYAQLARLDLATLRDEMINAIVGAAIGAASSLFLVCFLCVAVLVTAWDTPYRIQVAWLICIAWCLLTGACVYLAGRLMKGSSPFENIGSEIARDLSAIKHPEDYLHDEYPSASTAVEDNAVQPLDTGA